MVSSPRLQSPGTHYASDTVLVSEKEQQYLDHVSADECEEDATSVVTDSGSATIDHVKDSDFETMRKGIMNSFSVVSVKIQNLK
ncbi:hypothetical protein A2U01_0062421, partial [Trifolium medium]|nr:hypothetical protein [Trifolium medium]